MTYKQTVELIEHIVGDDFCEDLSMRLAHYPNFLDGDIANTMAGKLAAIYRIAHGTNKAHTCYHVHDDWRKDAQAQFDAIKKKSRKHLLTK